jgi:hypothetical protein
LPVSIGPGPTDKDGTPTTGLDPLDLRPRFFGVPDLPVSDNNHIRQFGPPSRPDATGYSAERRRRSPQAIEGPNFSTQGRTVS